MVDRISVTADDLLALPLEETLADRQERECLAYSRAFRERVRQCEEIGDVSGAQSWWLLFRLTAQAFLGTDKSGPVPLILARCGNGTTVPSDLCGDAVEAVRGLTFHVQDPELRARLLDVVWEANRDHTAAEGAVRAYMESARRLLDPEKWVAYVDRCERALALAFALGRDELQAAVVSDVETTVSEFGGEDPLFLTTRLVSLLLEYRRGDLETLSAVSHKAACMAEDALEFDRARSHLENLVLCCRRLGDTDGERLARGRIASCFERQGMLHFESGDPLLAAHWLEKAHVAYRETPGMRDKAVEVYVTLRTAQRDGAASMDSLDLPEMDVTELVEQAREHVSGYGFLDALFRLLCIVPTTDFSDAERITRDALDGAVWWRLAPRVTLEPDGRIASPGSAPASQSPEGHQPQLWEYVVEVVVEKQQRLGLAVIQPAMQRIMLEHAPSYRDVHEFVSGSPLVPFGREGLFAKGLLSGLRGDMVEALSVLLPQFENGLRHLLGSMRVEMSSMAKMGNQDVFQMGRILSRPELEKALGPDLVKEMKVLFTDEHGPKVRDHMSHGLIPPSGFYGGIAFYTWWLVCRVCFHPTLSKYVAPAEGTD